MPRYRKPARNNTVGVRELRVEDDFTRQRAHVGGVLQELAEIGGGGVHRSTKPECPTRADG
jgi:hypothetical protein